MSRRSATYSNSRKPISALRRMRAGLGDNGGMPSTATMGECDRASKQSMPKQARQRNQSSKVCPHRHFVLLGAAEMPPAFPSEMKWTPIGNPTWKTYNLLQSCIFVAPSVGLGALRFAKRVTQQFSTSLSSFISEYFNFS